MFSSYKFSPTGTVPDENEATAAIMQLCYYYAVIVLNK